MRGPAVLTLFAAATIAACNDPFGPIQATITNTIDTLELFAVNRTGLDKPSGYILALRNRYRIGVDNPAYNFDFLYRVDPTAGPELVPFGAVYQGDTASTGRPGFIETATPFNDIKVAEQAGYETEEPVPLQVGSTFYVRSGLPNGCFLGIPYYAKLEVLSFDDVAHSVKFRILVDINCGYRGLEPGIPTE